MEKPPRTLIPVEEFEGKLNQKRLQERATFFPEDFFPSKKAGWKFFDTEKPVPQELLVSAVSDIPGLYFIPSNTTAPMGSLLESYDVYPGQCSVFTGISLVGGAKTDPLRVHVEADLHCARPDLLDGDKQVTAEISDLGYEEIEEKNHFRYIANEFLERDCRMMYNLPAVTPPSYEESLRIERAMSELADVVVSKSGQNTLPVGEDERIIRKIEYYTRVCKRYSVRLQQKQGWRWNDGLRYKTKQECIADAPRLHNAIQTCLEETRRILQIILQKNVPIHRKQPVHLGYIGYCDIADIARVPDRVAILERLAIDKE